MNRPDTKSRYNRQVIFEPFGLKAQAALAAARITIVGCGGLGSSLAEQLTRAGAGQLRLIDGDKVELSNIHRQHLFTEADIGEPKVAVAQKKLRAINSETEIEIHPQMFTAETAAGLLAGSDLVLDALDNWAARSVLDAACWDAQLPWIFTGVSGMAMMTMNIIPGETCCLSCALDPPVDDPPATAGILPSSVWVASGLQCSEVFKFFAGGTAAMRREILAMDINSGRTQLLKAPAPDPACRCGKPLQ